MEPRSVRLRSRRPTADIDPLVGENTVARGRAERSHVPRSLATAAEWRARATAESLSIRQLIIEVTGRQSFVGAPGTVAEAINALVQADASDGFILVPHITPGGLDRFADTVVPLLQERGVFRGRIRGHDAARQTRVGAPRRQPERPGGGCGIVRLLKSA